MSGSGGRPSEMYGSSWEALRMSRWPSRMSRSGWETLTDVREWSGGPPGCPGVIGRSSLMSGSGRVTLPNVWAGS